MTEEQVPYPTGASPLWYNIRFRVSRELGNEFARIARAHQRSTVGQLTWMMMQAVREARTRHHEDETHGRQAMKEGQ